MRLHLLLPKVDPKALPVPSKCAYADCTSKQVRVHHQSSPFASHPLASRGN